MEPRLIIFLAFTGVTLTANTIVIWFAYRAFTNLAAKVTKSVGEFQASGETRAWLESLEAASIQAAAITNVAREQVENFDPILARAQNTYGFGLAKVDAKLEKMCDAVTDQVERAQEAILHPTRKISESFTLKSVVSWIP